jgi:uncharacterized protein with ParB-like and HNH nuclease domain
MKVTETRIDKFLASSETTFAIPVYQRNYDWTKVQCEQLIRDILSVGASEEHNAHFVGSIVYVLDDVYSASGLTELTIIDGQQRLTTLTLLYAAIYRFALQADDKQWAARIFDTYLINKYAQDTEKLKLKPTDENRLALAQILDSNSSIDPKGYSRLIENFRYFSAYLTRDNVKKIERGITRLVFVDIALDRQKDNPQRIFESLNSTGLELSQADLIRNFILMGLKRSEQERVFKKYWEPIEVNSTLRASQTSKVSEFIRDYLTLKFKDIPNKNSVYKLFKQKFNIGTDELDAALKEMLTFSKVYLKLLNPDEESDKDIKREIQYVNRLEINVAYPFLMQVYRDYDDGKISQVQFLSVIKLLQSYVWRRFIGGLSTNALNKIFMNLYDRIDHADYVASIEISLAQRSGGARFPTDMEINSLFQDKDMYNIKPKTRMYFFEKMENYGNKEIISFEDSSISVEHIFPQNPNSEWRKALSEREFSEMKDKYLHTIGNLTLSASNPELSNKDFLDKRDMNKSGGEQGYKYSKLWLNRQLQQKEGWGVSQVQARAKGLLQRFLEVWPGPKNITIPDRQMEEVNIFEADEPRHRELEYAVLFGEKIELKQVAKLYHLVFTKLFDAHPEAFIETGLGKKLQLSKDKKALRQPVKLNEHHFIEGNLASNDKFERIKSALTELGKEDDVYIKFA